MVRNYKKKIRDRSEGEVLEIIQRIDSGEISLCKASKEYGIPKSTLSKQWKRMRKNEPKKARGRRQVFTPEVEARMAKSLNVMARWGFPLTKKMVINTVQEFIESHNPVMQTPFLNNRPGHDWFVNFCRRNDLKLKNCEQLQANRQQNTSDPFIIYQFYDLLESKMDELQLENKPENIWNLDESGFCHDPSKCKALMKTKTSAFRTIMGSGKLNTTVLACCSASGEMLPPLIIFKAKSLWSTWRGQNDISGTMYSTSENGFITSSIFNQYFQKFCITVTQRPLLVILDGHITHLSSMVVERAIAENITILKLPSHTTDLLQPLDRTVFKPIKTDWEHELIDWQMNNNRQLTKAEFSQIVCKVWRKVQTENIVKGFATMGIYPLNPSKYPVSRLNPNKLEKYRAFKANASTTTDSTLDIDADAPFSGGVVPTSTPVRDPVVLNSFASASNSSSSVIDTSSCSANATLDTASHGNSYATSANATALIEESPGTKFEKCLLSKVNKTQPGEAKRRKIDGGGKVITTEEYLEQIEKVKKPKVRSSFFIIFRLM
jgi:hypothetical protein